jgi:hypothetical protein
MAIPPSKNTVMKWLGFTPVSYPMELIHRSSESFGSRQKGKIEPVFEWSILLVAIFQRSA